MILKSESDLKKTISKLRKNKKIIGAMSGGYDLLHKGHQNAILFSSEQVDSLFVLVNSDSSIKKYKGETRPINSEKNRMEELNSFYSAISIGNGDLINGSRLVYKLEDKSMRLLNIFGNKFFS